MNVVPFLFRVAFKLAPAFMTVVVAGFLYEQYNTLARMAIFQVLLENKSTETEFLKREVRRRVSGKGLLPAFLAKHMTPDEILAGIMAEEFVTSVEVRGPSSAKYVRETRLSLTDKGRVVAKRTTSRG